MLFLRQILTIALALLVVRVASAGDYGPEYFVPTPLPSLEQRIKDAELIVRLGIETRKHEVVGRVLEVLKGSYDPKDHPDDPKGYFAFGIPARQFKMDHEEEIWFLGKSEVLYAPADSQPDPEAITFRPAKVYADRLELHVHKGVVAFPTVGRRYHAEVLQTKSYKRGDFLTEIRSTVRTLNGK